MNRVLWQHKPKQSVKKTGNVKLQKTISGLEKTSVINFSQIITIDKSRLTEQILMLPKNYIGKINESIRNIFDSES